MDDVLLELTGEPAAEDAPTEAAEAEDGDDAPTDVGDDDVTEDDTVAGDEEITGDEEIIGEDLWLVDGGGSGDDGLVDDGTSGDGILGGDDDLAGDDSYFDEAAGDDAGLVDVESYPDDDQFIWDGDFGTDFGATDAIVWTMAIFDESWFVRDDKGETLPEDEIPGDGAGTSLEGPDILGICVCFPFDAIV